MPHKSNDLNHRFNILHLYWLRNHPVWAATVHPWRELSHICSKLHPGVGSASASAQKNWSSWDPATSCLCHWSSLVGLTWTFYTFLANTWSLLAVHLLWQTNQVWAREGAVASWQLATKTGCAPTCLRTGCLCLWWETRLRSNRWFTIVSCVPDNSTQDKVCTSVFSLDNVCVSSVLTRNLIWQNIW